MSSRGDSGRGDPGRRNFGLTSRRVGTLVSVLFGLFVLFDIALFGWLILNSLSQREIEKVLIETQEEAEPLARQLAERADELRQKDLFVVISVAEETKKNLSSVLLNREIVSSFKIYDRDGTIVFEQSHEEDLGGEIREEAREESDELRGAGLQIRGGFETEVPIGDIGSLVIGISELELERRIDVLRRDLVRQAYLIGAITVTLLGAAFLFIRILFKRADRLEKQAVDAERMAMIGTLASGLAHEIRNPLNSLNLNMQMLEEEAEERGGAGSEKRLLSITRSEIGRLENLVTDFLSYAKPRPLDLEEIAPEELFRKVVEILSGELREMGCEIRIRDESGGEKIRVDRDQMNQLLLNLAKNALAATVETDRDGLIELRAFPNSDRMVLEVRDNGTGIETGQQGKIFDLFFSTKKGGTGLGLAIVERIAISHGAEIEVDSQPGLETKVRLLLPRSGDPALFANLPPEPRTLPGS